MAHILAAGTVSTGAVSQLAAVSSDERVGDAAVQGMITASAFVVAGILLHVVAVGSWVRIKQVVGRSRILRASGKSEPNAEEHPAAAGC